MNHSLVVLKPGVNAMKQDDGLSDKREKHKGECQEPQQPSKRHRTEEDGEPYSGPSKVNQESRFWSKPRVTRSFTRKLTCHGLVAASFEGKSKSISLFDELKAMAGLDKELRLNKSERWQLL